MMNWNDEVKIHFLICLNNEKNFSLTEYIYESNYSILRI